MTVIVYSKPACVQCAATTRALDAKGIGYELVDLTAAEQKKGAGRPPTSGPLRSPGARNG